MLQCVGLHPYLLWSVMHTLIDTKNPELREHFTELAIESWRFANLFGRVLNKLDTSEAQRYASQQRYFLKRVDEHLAYINLRIVNLEGQAYDTGMAATPLNVEDFGPNDLLVVDLVVEPLLMGPDGIVKSATVMLKQAHA